MSVLVGLVHERTVYLGSDSIGVDMENYTSEVRRDAKVVARGGIVIGMAGDFRRWQLVQHMLIVPKRKRDQDIHGFMVSAFADALRKCYRDGGISEYVGKDDDEVDLLVGVAGRLFRVDSGLAVAECQAGFDAVGGGGASAIGAFHAQELVLAACRRSKRPLPYSPEARVLDALTAAERATPVVRRPFVIVSAPPRGRRADA